MRTFSRFALSIASTLCLTGLSCCNSGSGLPFGLPASANTISNSVRRVSVLEATGQSGSSPPLVELSPGYGVNISFIPTGEIVEKVWLDNPSFATLDVDGCLSGLGSQGKPCQPNGARVLHLRGINPLNIPGLPKTNSTLLTAITSGTSRQRVYLFRVALASGTPQYHTIEVTPVSVSTPSNTKYRSIVDSISDYSVFSRGLAVAMQRGLIRTGQPLETRIRNFLARVQAGESIESAASTSGISLNLVERLAQLGRTGNPVLAPATTSAHTK